MAGERRKKAAVVGVRGASTTKYHAIQPPQRRAVASETFACDAFQPITVDAPWRALLGNRQAQASRPPPIAAGQHGEVLVRRLGRLREDITEVTGPSKASIRRQTIAVARGTVPVNQDVSRARPLARRAFNTLRPFRVAILARKPWVRARFKRLGWKVCFMTLNPRRRRGRKATQDHSKKTLDYIFLRCTGQRASAFFGFPAVDNFTKPG